MELPIHRRRKGTDKGLFISWPKLAPIILNFVR